MSEITSKASSEALAYLERRKANPSCETARLIFGLDATASRENMWDIACKVQGDMFHEVTSIGGLQIQLTYYRGYDECRASNWMSHAVQLTSLMRKIRCEAGMTQIGKVLKHAKKECSNVRVSALVFAGDTFEEQPDRVMPLAHELAALKLPVFMFQEGSNKTATKYFAEIARITKGAHCQFDANSARQLSELLRAVALFAVGGVAALTGRKDAGAVRLLGQLK